MQLEGKIKMIDETKTYGNNGFRKRELVITTEEQYPQDILIEFVQDKCDILDGCFVGQNVKVNINIRGREWVNPQGETKYFNTIQGWKVETLGGSRPTNQQSQSNQSPSTDAFEPSDDFNEEEEDDLPF